MYLCVTGHSRNPAFKDMYHEKFDHKFSACIVLYCLVECIVTITCGQLYQMFCGGVCLLISCFKIPASKAMLNKELAF